MDDKLNKNPAEARALTDEELDHASGGRYVYHSAGQTYACDTCMVYLTVRSTGRLIHKRCKNEMRFLRTTEERKSVTENPQYQKVSSSEAAID